MILDRSPFYGESGGQVGDMGTIRGENFVFEVKDTKKDNDFQIHIGRVVEGKATVNDKVRAIVESPRREAIRRAHTATHVLHHALQGQLGKHAQQAGSKVEPDRLRFDFANPEAIPRDRLRSIEEEVNLKVLDAEPVTWSLMPIEQARGLGALALFGEKYPDIVRVVQMGEFSKELCGGTHLENVGQVGLFKIIGEESVASGTRRITALTGKAALDYVRAEEETLSQVAATLRVPTAQAVDRVAALLEEVKNLKKQLAQRKEQGNPGTKLSTDELISAATEVNGIKVIAQTIDNANPDELRQLIDVLRRKLPERMAVLLASAIEGKVHLASAVTADLIEQGYHAGKWLKEVAPKVGGGGGGRPDMAQAGGKDPAKIPDALDHAIKTIASIFGGK
jgi:alanyl-tRNA synthetase